MPSGLQMYDFLIQPIRREDKLRGKEFVRRLFLGPQAHWDDSWDTAAAVKNLWSITECPDEYLQYLKRIVGWTPDLDPITDGLSADTLRRLIAVSAQLWKDRGSEDAVIDVLHFLTGMRTRVWNWFDYRWLVDEADVGYGTWLVNSLASVEPAELRWHIRIVDDGTLDHELIKSVCNLMRACGERIDISYLLFLDLFQDEGETSQWDQTVGTGMAVTGGTLRLPDNASAERAIAIVDGSLTWSELSVSARLRGAYDVTGKLGLIFYYTDADNYYAASFDIALNKLYLDKVTAGTPTNIATVDLGPLGIWLHHDIYYMMRVVAVDEASTNRVKLYLDEVLCIDTTDSDHTEGSVGLFHDSGLDLECDEIEVMPVPMTTDEIGINYGG